MRLIIAGGRYFKPSIHHTQWLNRLNDELVAAGTPLTQVLSGKAAGADQFGEMWAAEHAIPVAEFPPDWVAYGKSAGPRRNRQMAENADAVVLFPGGDGTQSMFDIARALNLKIYDWRERTDSPPPATRQEIVNLLEKPDP